MLMLFMKGSGNIFRAFLLATCEKRSAGKALAGNESASYRASGAGAKPTSEDSMTMTDAIVSSWQRSEHLPDRVSRQRIASGAIIFCLCL
jgi:hypothetical protein